MSYITIYGMNFEYKMLYNPYGDYTNVFINLKGKEYTRKTIWRLIPPNEQVAVVIEIITEKHKNDQVADK